MRCPDCEHIDDHIFETTAFWIHLPTQESEQKLASFCAEHQLVADQISSKSLKLIIGKADIETFISAFSSCIQGQELASTKILTTDAHAPNGDPKPEDIGRVLAGDVFINRFEGGWIVDALEAERYESHFQPIIRANGIRAGETFAYESLFRMSDDTGAIIPPGKVFSMASNSSLLFVLDLAARRSAVEYASKAKLGGKLFINFNPSSIYDPSFCLRTTAAAIEEAGLAPSDIVFELTETHQARDKAHLQAILSFYRRAGFGIALDDIGSGYSSLNLLHEVRPDYAKIDMELIRGIDKDRFKQTIVENLLKMTSTNGIQTVAEGIETEAEADWVHQAGADFLQGFYFGKPEPMHKQAA